MMNRYGQLQKAMPRLKIFREEVKLLLPTPEARQKFWRDHLTVETLKTILKGRVDDYRGETLTMKLVVLGLNHRSAAVEVRERFSFDKDEVASALNRLYEFDCVQNALFCLHVIELKSMRP